MRRGRRLDEGTHAISFSPEMPRSEGMDCLKGPRLKGWIESPNALRWRLGRLLRCAFIQTESSKIIIGNLAHGLIVQPIDAGNN